MKITLGFSVHKVEKNVLKCLTNFENVSISNFGEINYIFLLYKSKRTQMSSTCPSASSGSKCCTQENTSVMKLSASEDLNPHREVIVDNSFVTDKASMGGGTQMAIFY